MKKDKNKIEHIHGCCDCGTVVENQKADFRKIPEIMDKIFNVLKETQADEDEAINACLSIVAAFMHTNIPKKNMEEALDGIRDYLENLIEAGSDY